MELLKLEGAECTICENGKRILEAFEQSVPGEYDMKLLKKTIRNIKLGREEAQFIDQ